MREGNRGQSGGIGKELRMKERNSRPIGEKYE